jgi:beta-propeller uncharacterized protein DUF5122
VPVMRIVGKVMKTLLRAVRSIVPLLIGAAILVGAASPANAGVSGPAASVVVSASAASVVVSASADHTATFNGAVRAVAYAGTTVFVGGDFTVAYWHGQSVLRQRIAAIDATTGALLPLNPGADGLVRGLAVDNGTVFVVGDFTSVGGQPRRHLAAFDADTGQLRSGFAEPVNNLAYAAAVGSGRLYIGGSFTTVGGQSRLHAAAFDLATGGLDATWQPTADARVEAIATTPGRVYLAGAFAQVDAIAGTAHVAAVDPVLGTVDTTFHSSVGLPAHAIAVTSMAIYLAVAGPGGRGVRLDLTGRTLWTIAFDGDPQAVTVADRVYFGGHFDDACTSARPTYGGCVTGYVPRVKFAATDENGVLSGWAPAGNGVHGVFALATDAGQTHLAAGGEFTTVNGVSQRRFAQFSG